MQAFILSDLHPDTWFSYANKPSKLRGDEVKEDVVFNTMEYLWQYFNYPDTDAIVVAGDVANDWLTYTRAVKWLSNKYKEVYMCLGNHDILVRGGTPSRSNLQFKTSEEKIAAIQDFCNKLGNVHLLARDQVRTRYDSHCFAPRTSYYTIYQEDAENGTVTEEPWKDCYYSSRGNNTIKAFTTDGIGLNETFCPDVLLRNDLAKRYDTDKNLVVTEQELLDAPETTPYDLTGDGISDARELTLLKRVALGKLKRAAKWRWSNGDLNADYQLNEGDVRCLMDFLFEESFEENAEGTSENTAEAPPYLYMAE